MRKLLTLLSFLAIPYFTLANEKIKVAATPVPHAEILEFIQPMLKEEGLDLEIVVVTDYVLPNIMLNEKEVDANFMQHLPYLEEFNKNNKMSLLPVAKIHVEPFGAYSKKIKSISELKEGAKISIPNDPTNGGRALILLHKNGIITLNDPNNILSTLQDIKENPKKIQFAELEAPMLARTLDEVDLALINTNFALDANLNPQKDALFIEGSDSPYVNIVVARSDNQDSEAIKKLTKTLRSEAVKKFINEKYQGSILPAF